MVFYAIYLVSGAGLHSINSDILQSVVAHALKHGLPFIIGGDFNYEQAMIISWFRTLGLIADTVATSKSSCKTISSESIIDYFVMSTDLGCLAPTATLDNRFFHSPHVPVDLDLSIVSDMYVDAIRKPPAIPNAPLQGPLYGDV